MVGTGEFIVDVDPQVSRDLHCLEGFPLDFDVQVPIVASGRRSVYHYF
jgi:hypothetical protein